jgi:hypothetical protein
LDGKMYALVPHSSTNSWLFAAGFVPFGIVSVMSYPVEPALPVLMLWPTTMPSFAGFWSAALAR